MLPHLDLPRPKILENDSMPVGVQKVLPFGWWSRGESNPSITELHAKGE
jgi:hypothetical protein